MTIQIHIGISTSDAADNCPAFVPRRLIVAGAAANWGHITRTREAWTLDRRRSPRIPRLSAQQVALIPQCAECRGVWPAADDDRWRAYLDMEDELVFYSPGWAEREFVD